MFCFLDFVNAHYRVNPRKRVFHNHIRLRRVHQLEENHRDDGRENDVKHQVGKQFGLRRAVAVIECDRRQNRKESVDYHGVSRHRDAKTARVTHREFFVIVDCGFEFFERKHRLSESLDDGDSAHVFDGFLGHIFEGGVVGFDIFFEVFAHHKHIHYQKRQNDVCDAQKADFPIEIQQKRNHCKRCYDCDGPVGQDVRHKVFERAGSVDDDFTNFAAALVLDVSEGHPQHFCDALFADVCHRAEGSEVRTSQRAKIHAHCVYGVFDSRKTVILNVLRL